MTLIIAGYTFDPAHDYSSVWTEASLTEEAIPKSSMGFVPSRRETEPSGIFIAADSTITSTTETLLSGFRKVYPVAVRLWQPYFIGESFRDYRNVCMETEIAVGFAGSTLTAQHCMNGITEHLSKLRVSCKPPGDGPIQYAILMDCEKNPLDDGSTYWAEDTFTSSSDARELLTAEYIASVILHSLKGSLSSARQYKISEKGFHTLLTPFIAGIQCPATQKFHLYAFLMKPETIDGVMNVRVEKQSVPHEKVTVLGMTQEFESDAQVAYTDTRNAGGSTETAMFDFLNTAIDKVKSRGEKGIDRPAVLKVLSRNGLTITDRQ